jgi:predicted transcriptional regulator
MKKTEENYHLTKRDKEVIQIMWNAEKPLIAAEIVRAQEDLNIHTVQVSLKKLLNMKLIEVAGVEYSGTSLSRSYRPTISATEYETRKYIYAIKNIGDKDLSVSQFVTTFLEHEDEKRTLEELEKLERLIQERKQQIINDVKSKNK